MKKLSSLTVTNIHRHVVWQGRLRVQAICMFEIRKGYKLTKPMDKFFKVVGIVFVSILLVVSVVVMSALGWPTIRNAYNQLSTPTLSAQAALAEFAHSRSEAAEASAKMLRAQADSLEATRNFRQATETARGELTKALADLNATSQALNVRAVNIGDAVTNLHEQAVVSLATGIRQLMDHVSSNSVSSRVDALEARVGAVESTMTNGFNALGQGFAALTSSVSKLSIDVGRVAPNTNAVPSFDLWSKFRMIGLYPAGHSVWAAGMKRIYVELKGSVDGVVLAQVELAVREWFNTKPSVITGLSTRGQGREARIESELGAYLRDKFPGKEVSLKAELK